MRSSLDYAGFAQLCERSPIMREIMRAHNRIIPRSLVQSSWCSLKLNKKRVRLDAAKFFFSNTVINEWNMLSISKKVDGNGEEWHVCLAQLFSAYAPFILCTAARIRGTRRQEG